MQVVIFAGGLGTRLSEKTKDVPKPMVEVGNTPILEHIMEIYAKQGHSDFLIACGYKQNVIKRYFYEQFSLGTNLSLDFNAKTSSCMISSKYDKWRVSLIDTGLNTQTGARLKLLEPYLEEEFLLTYGDGLGNVDISKLLSQHRSNGAEITITTINPKSRYGSLVVEGSRVAEFVEKPKFNSTIVNAGYMALNKSFLRHIEANDLSIALESEPFERVVRCNRMHAYHHTGFWHPMDTLRDNLALNEIWNSGQKPWLEL